ncbi:MAG: TRAM domain-containing protein, partial [Bacilli bacterium]
TLASYENLMPAVHLPVQSGDDEILRRMGRRYTASSYLALYNSLRLALPQGSITTDIIVGFPGETEEQFAHTLALVEQCQFDAAYTFLYSPREGTPAAKMVDDVPLEVKKARFQRLTKVVATAAHQRNQAYLQRIVPVLVEGPSKRNPSILSGYSDTNKLVNFKGDPATIGTIVPVKITAIKSWTLEGEMVHE